jgi:hypothetical protein
MSACSSERGLTETNADHTVRCLLGFGQPRTPIANGVDHCVGLKADGSPYHSPWASNGGGKLVGVAGFESSSFLGCRSAAKVNQAGRGTDREVVTYLITNNNNLLAQS